MAALLFKNLFSGNKPENGELTINLNLTIKIEADGSLSVMPTGESPQKKSTGVLSKGEEKIDYQLPDLDEVQTLIPFGKNV